MTADFLSERAAKGGCGRCNLALGIIENSGGILVKFLEYLESHRA